MLDRINGVDFFKVFMLFSVKNYFPLKIGFLFSTNAATPSLKS
jgi:hypothetical protein